MIETTFIAYLPILLLVVGMLMLLPAPLLAAHRMLAGSAVLAIALGSALLAVMGVGTLFLLPCLAFLIAAPLLERSRFLGLAAAALAGSAAIHYAIPLLSPYLPASDTVMMMQVALIVALLIGMVGGMKLPLHPQRHRNDGHAVWHAAPQGLILAGWVLVTAAIAGTVGIATMGRAQVIAALVAALAALAHAQLGHGRDSWQKAGEGLLAGVVITLLVPLAPLAAAAAGLLAGFLVTRSEAIALSLRLDDPHHFLGALLLPAMFGLLLPGIAELALLAGQLKWLGAAIALAAVISLILWPLSMFLLGIALPPRLVREGVQPR